VHRTLSSLGIWCFASVDAPENVKPRKIFITNCQTNSPKSEDIGHVRKSGWISSVSCRDVTLEESFRSNHLPRRIIL